MLDLVDRVEMINLLDLIYLSQHKAKSRATQFCTAQLAQLKSDNCIPFSKLVI